MKAVPKPVRNIRAATRTRNLGNAHYRLAKAKAKKNQPGADIILKAGKILGVKAI